MLQQSFDGRTERGRLQFGWIPIGGSMIADHSILIDDEDVREMNRGMVRTDQNVGGSGLAAIEENGTSDLVGRDELADRGEIVRRIDNRHGHYLAAVFRLELFNHAGELDAGGAVCLDEVEDNDLAAIIGHIVLIEMHVRQGEAGRAARRIGRQKRIRAE